MSKGDRVKNFWSKVDKSSGCWLWTAGKLGKGYGQFLGNSGVISAHRFSYELHYGKIPKGMYICHHCDNPLCVKPDHLFLGTPRDNVMDCIKKGRFNSPYGESHWWAKLSNEQVTEIKERAKNGGIALRRMAPEYGVSDQCIYEIVNNRTRRKA